MSVAFRATMLWNEVVLDFEMNMKRKKHRRNLCWFDNTFTGREACKFLLKRLQQNELFGPDINSRKVKLLLAKLLSAGVFQNVIRSTPYFRSKGLYRFPQKLPLTALTLSSQNEKTVKCEPNRGNVNPVRLTSEIAEIRDKMMLLYNQNIVHVDDTLHWQTATNDCAFTNDDGCKKIFYSDYCQSLMLDLEMNKEVWRNKVINRIRDIMGVNAERFLALLMQKATIWPSMNACLLVRTHKRRTKFPLVDESLRSLGFYGFFSDKDKMMYASYPRDIAQCLCNILVERYQVMSIFAEMSLTMIYFYCFLNELDGERKEEEDENLLRFSAEEANTMEYKPLRPMVACDNSSESVDDTVSNASSEYYPEEDLDEAIQEAQNFLWKLTTPTRQVRGARPPQMCLETAFACESPVTRVVCRPDAAASSSQSAVQEGCADTYRKHWRCTPHRCLYDKNNEEHIKIQNLLKAIIVVTKDSQPESADTLHKSMSLFASICHRKTAKFWVEEVKLYAIHLYRLVFLFLEPEDYNMLEAALFVLSELKKDKKEGVRDELYDNIYWVVFGRTNDGHAFRDIMEFFIDNWKELFKPFEIEQILTKESVSFLKDLKSVFVSNFALKTDFSNVAEDFPHKTWSEPDTSLAFEQLKIQSQNFRVEVKPVPPPKEKKQPTKKKDKKAVAQDAAAAPVVAADVVATGAIPKCKNVATNTDEASEAISQPPEPVRNQKAAEKPKPSSCVKITKEVFKKQVITNSQKALEDLLDQIINDKKMSEKERQKRLKKFSEEYPHIFQKRFTTKPTKKGHSMRI